MYDITCARSFQRVFSLYRAIIEAKNIKPTDIPCVIVGTKLDTLGKRKRMVPLAALNRLSALLSVPAFETCSQAFTVINYIFKELIDQCQNIVNSDLEKYLANKIDEEERKNRQHSMLSELPPEFFNRNRHRNYMEVC